MTTMSNPHTDGPRAPDAMPAPPEHRVTSLIPFVHVDDVERAIAFYQYLEFTVTSVYKYRETPVWAALQSGGAELVSRVVSFLLKSGMLWYAKNWTAQAGVGVD